MKHVRTFDESNQLREFSWDINESLVMHYLTCNSYYKLEFIKEAFVSSSLDSENPGTVAVVDGKELKLTPFKFQNVPPPMCSLKLDFQVPISHVSFLIFGCGDNMCVQLTDNSVHFFKSNFKSRSVDMPKLIGSMHLDNPDLFDYRQSQWARENMLMVLAYNRKEGHDSVQIIYFKEENSAVSVLRKETIRLDSKKIIRLQMCHDGRIILQDVEGNIFEAQEEEGTWTCQLRETFPTLCPRFDSFTIGKDANDKETVYIGLTGCNKLYLNQKLLSRECTSFFVNSEYLLLTTFSQNLNLIPRTVEYEGGNFC